MCIPQNHPLRHVPGPQTPLQRHVHPAEPPTATCTRFADPASATCASPRTTYCDMYPARRPRSSDMCIPQDHLLRHVPRQPTPLQRHVPPQDPLLRHVTRQPTPLLRHVSARQRNAGLRPASRPQAAKLRPRRGNPKQRRRSDVRAQLSPRRSLWRGRHPAEGSPGVSPAARAMPVGDRRSTAVRASGGLHSHANRRAAHVAAPPAGTATNTPSPPATCASRRIRYCDVYPARRLSRCARQGQ